MSARRDLAEEQRARAVRAELELEAARSVITDLEAELAAARKAPDVSRDHWRTRALVAEKRLKAVSSAIESMFIGHGEGPADLCDRCADREKLRAALSGATEPAARAEVES